MNVPAPASVMQADRQFSILSGDEADREYFSEVGAAGSLLLAWYAERNKASGTTGKDTFELAQMNDMLTRFNYTLGALGIKHLFPAPDSQERVRIDLTDSGF